MMLLHFTIQQRATHENSAVLQQQILDLSKRYIKALAEENQSVMDGPYVGTMTAYGEWSIQTVTEKKPSIHHQTRSQHLSSVNVVSTSQIKQRNWIHFGLDSFVKRIHPCRG